MDSLRVTRALHRAAFSLGKPLVIVQSHLVRG